ncbi:small, acid-soluble spore protein, alpha/beta type [Haloplasma contractile]|uniref:small, acid-soluble spore protein, alpha/beta type n=1 Tax=Haloplasma contractile TaxID=471825 RepID=UPI0002123323|nr:small, acid-soluble spore protein, alpha/beta type [Haloplasma contractile]
MARDFENEKRIQDGMNQMKKQVSTEFGMEEKPILNGGERTSKSIGEEAGPVGGEITKRLIEIAQNELSKNYNNK